MAFSRIVAAHVALAVGLLVGGLSIAPEQADAAQAYYCSCDGEKKRFLASSRYCERQNKVKQCTMALYRKTYAPACKERGCRLP